MGQNNWQMRLPRSPAVDQIWLLHSKEKTQISVVLFLYSWFSPLIHTFLLSFPSCTNILSGSGSIKGPGTRFTFAPTPPLPAVPEKQRLSGSLWGRSPGRHSSLETCTTCAPAAPPSPPSPPPPLRAPLPTTRQTRRPWRVKRRGTDRPPSPCCSLHCWSSWGVSLNPNRDARPAERL